MIFGINAGKIWLIAMLCLCFFVVPLILYGICEAVKRIDRKRLGRDNPYCKNCTAVKEINMAKKQYTATTDYEKKTQKGNAEIWN